MYQHCKAFVEDVLLVSEEDIVSAVFTLYGCGLVVEPAGDTAFAALLHNRVTDVKVNNVVVLLTGGNVTPQELCQLSEML